MLDLLQVCMVSHAIFRLLVDRKAVCVLYCEMVIRFNHPIKQTPS